MSYRKIGVLIVLSGLLQFAARAKQSKDDEYKVQEFTWNDHQLQAIVQRYSNDRNALSFDQLVRDSAHLGFEFIKVGLGEPFEKRYRSADTIEITVHGNCELYLFLDSVEVPREDIDQEKPDLILNTEVIPQKLPPPPPPGSGFEDDELEEEPVIADFYPGANSKIKKRKKLYKARWFWYGFTEYRGKTWSIKAQLNGDPKQVDAQEQLLLSLLQETKVRTFNPCDYHTKREVSLESDVFSAASQIMQALLKGDTMTYFQHIMNAKDFEFLLTKMISARPDRASRLEREIGRLDRQYNRLYVNRPKIDSLLMGMHLADLDISFHVRVRTEHITLYEAHLFIPLKEEEGINFRLSLMKTPRGFVLTNKVTTNGANRRRDKKVLNATLYRMKLARRRLKGMYLCDLLNENAGDITKVQVIGTSVVLHHQLMHDSTIISLKELPDLSKKEWSKIKMAAVTFQGKEIVQSPTLSPTDKALSSEITFLETVNDRALLQDVDWILQNYADTNEIKNVVAYRFDNSSPVERDNTDRLVEKSVRRRFRAARNLRKKSAEINRFFTAAEAMSDSVPVRFFLGRRSDRNNLRRTEFRTIVGDISYTVNMKGYWQKGKKNPFQMVYKLYVDDDKTKGVKLDDSYSLDSLYQTKEPVLDYFQSRFGRAMIWEFVCSKDTLKYIHVTYDGPIGAFKGKYTEKVYLDKVPKSFFNKSPLFRRLSDLRGARVRTVKRQNYLHTDEFDIELN